MVSVCHGGNSGELVSIPAMKGTVAVNTYKKYIKRRIPYGTQAREGTPIMA